MISARSIGSTKNTKKALTKLLRNDQYSDLEAFGQKGVEALREATPVDDGETAASWSYTIEKTGKGASITWTNSHTNKGANIAILIQYGHGTGTGGYVQGRDYINPAVQPIFDQIADDVWRRVKE